MPMVRVNADVVGDDAATRKPMMKENFMFVVVGADLSKSRVGC